MRSFYWTACKILVWPVILIICPRLIVALLNRFVCCRSPLSTVYSVATNTFVNHCFQSTRIFYTVPRKLTFSTAYRCIIVVVFFVNNKLLLRWYTLVIITLTYFTVDHRFFFFLFYYNLLFVFYRHFHVDWLISTYLTINYIHSAQNGN